MYEKPSCKVLSTLQVWFGNNPRACLGQFLPTTTAQRSAPGRECPPGPASPSLAGTRAHNLLPWASTAKTRVLLAGNRAGSIILPGLGKSWISQLFSIFKLYQQEYAVSTN